MKLLYLTVLDFPRRVANRAQIINMSESFSLITQFRLMVAHLYITTGEFFEFYGVDDRFDVFCIDQNRMPSKLKMLWNIAYNLLTFRPDVVYVREEKLALLLSFIRVPFVYEVHEIMEGNIHRQMKVIQRSLMSVVISKGLMNDLMKIGVDEDKLFLSHLAMKPINNKEAIEQSKLNDRSVDEVRVMYSGRFSKHKGVHCVVEALRYLPDNFKLYLVGGFEGEKEELEQFARDQGVEGKICVVGFVQHSQVYRYLLESDILVIPNSAEKNIFRHTNPLKLYEYLEAGKPVVASDIESIREVVGDGIVTYFQPDCPKDLALKIQELADDPERWEGMVDQGARLVATKTWKQRTQDLVTEINIRLKGKEHSSYN